jgi:glycerophosphoryl diester phosphodiesterase
MKSTLKIVFLYFLATIWGGCQESIPPINNLNNGIIEPLGHGGMGVRSLFYPFNSYESIEASLENGASGTELDVQLTADNELVVFHDKRLESKTSGEGFAIDHTLAEMTALDYDFFSINTFKVTSLESVLELLGSEKIAMLDCKFHPGDHNIEDYRIKFATAIDEVARKHDMEEKLFVEARDRLLLEELGRMNPKLKLFLQPIDSVDVLDYAERHNLFGLSLSVKKVSRHFVQKAQDAGLRVALFGTNTRSKNKQAIDMHPDYIQTDQLSHLINTLNAN